MHSLIRWNWLVVGGLTVSITSWTCMAAPAPAPAPSITPAPNAGVEIWKRQGGPDAVSFAQILLTAIPLSLRQIAATNAPAVSSILWEEFLDDKRPQWFLELPWDIQSYLVKEFGPKTALLPTPPQTTGAQVTPTHSDWEWPQSTSIWQSPQASPSVSYTVPSSPARSSAVSATKGTSMTASVAVTFSTFTRSRSASRSRFMTTSPAATVSSQVSMRSASASSAPSTSLQPLSPPASDEGLSRSQKIGLGVGIPFGIFGAAAVLFGCCFLLRRRRNKHEAGSVPPSSPGFIPRFAFQDKSTDHFDHRTPLNPNMTEVNREQGTMNWDDEGYDPYESTAYDSSPMGASHHGHPYPPASSAPAMAMQDATTVMAPALYHTHSSNRARGKRTSYSSLHSVAEVSEPDDLSESPVLGRQNTPSQKSRRPSMPPVLETPSVPRAATIKRKPVGENPTTMSPAAEMASQSLLRPPIRTVDYSGSSSSGLALSTDSSIAAPNHNDPTSPISPLSQHAPTNPFKNDYSYVEDYGPEYQTGYVDHEDGLYGGNRSLDRYPDPSPPRRSSKTEWPLRNISLGHRRNKSPLWDRIYENP